MSSAHDETHSDAHPTVEGAEVSASAPSRVVGLSPGDVLGRFRVLERLGAGAMGVVYAAYDGQLDRRVAIKVLHRQLADPDSASARDNLIAEARALARLSHPNVVVVYDVGKVEDAVFIAMEYIEGVTLRRWLGERPRSWQEIVEVYVHAGRGLDAAHQAGLIHRDFKPENVIVDREGRVRVLDFGLARVQDPAQTSPAAEGIVGTPGYMAPERFAGLPADARSDQYGFCVALYEGLWGRRPFAGSSLSALARAVLEDPPASPPESAVPERVRAAVMRGLSREPAERFASMTELLQRLDAPSRPVRWGTIAIVGSIALGVGVAGTLAASRERPCASIAESFADSWGEARRRAIAEAIASDELALHVDHTAATWAERWVEAAKGACDAHARGQIAAVQYERRLACLDRRRRTFDVGLSLVERGDDDVVERAPELLGELRDPSGCNDADELAREIELPMDPELARAVELADAALDELDVLLVAMRTREARDKLENAREILAVDHAGIRARAVYTEAHLVRNEGDYARTERLLTDAIVEATRASTPRTALEAALMLEFVVGFRFARPDDGRFWAEYARALIEAGAGGSEGLADVEQGLGHIAFNEGRYDVARVHYERALQLTEEHYGPEDHRVAAVLQDLGDLAARRGEHESAIAFLERARDLHGRVYGPEHPSAVVFASNLASALGSVGRTDESIEMLLEAIEIGERVLGPDHPDLAPVLGNLGEAYSGIGEYHSALSALERAAGLVEWWYGPDHPLMGYAYNGRALLFERMGLLADAEAESRSAVGVRTRALGQKHPLVAASLVHECDLLGQADPQAALARAEAALVSCNDDSTCAEVRVGAELCQGDQLLQLRRIAEAAGRYAAALERAEHARQRAAARFGLARTAWAEARRDEAIRFAREARDMVPAFEPEAARIDEWLRTHM